MDLRTPSGDEIPIEGDETVIGRDPSSDLVLEYARISRAHAAIRSAQKRFFHRVNIAQKIADKQRP